MIAVAATRSRSLATAGLAAAVAAFTLACGGPTRMEIPIETAIQPKLDVSAFQRVLVAGFVAGGIEDVDANQETVRLLRSQLRSKSSLKVIDADAMPLIDIAQDQNNASATEAGPAREGTTTGTNPGGAPNHPPAQTLLSAKNIKEEKDLEPYERLFANTAYWKKIGEEHQTPLIVTGTILFSQNLRSGYVQREQETYDSFGRRQVTPLRTFMERKGFVLRPKFVFIDGRTGATIYSETYREEVLYNAQQNTPALSSYFELMDRLIPNFLNALSSQKVKGTRVLLR